MSDLPKTISIDGKNHAVESLSDAAKKQIANIRVVDQELARLETLTAIAKTAKALRLSRFDLKYSAGPLSHARMMRAIELYGTRVIPRVREILAEETVAA